MTATSTHLSPIKNLFRRLRGDERGFTLVFFAVSLPVMLGLVGLAIDFGRLYTFDTRLAGAADAAALAAAKELDRAPAALERARNAAVALTNRADGDGTVGFRFRFAATLADLRSSPDFTLADTEAGEAAFVEVVTLRRSFTASFLQFVGAAAVPLQRRAVARSVYQACDISPLLLCQREPERFIAGARKGRQYRLRAGIGTADGALLGLSTPGDETPAMTQRLLASDRPAFCLTEGMSPVATFSAQQLDDAINPRFDRYVNRSGPIAPELAAFPPAPNVIKGQRYNSCQSPPNAADTAPPYPLPRDSAFRALTLATPYDLGQGDWKTAPAYGGSASRAAFALGEYIDWNHADKNPIFQGSLANSATRYELYLKELGRDEGSADQSVSTFAGALAATLPTGGPSAGPFRTLSEYPEPRCYRGARPANDPRRRLIYAAIADCGNPADRSSPYRLSLRVAKLFVTEPSDGGAVLVEYLGALTPLDADGKLRHVVTLVDAD